MTRRKILLATEALIAQHGLANVSTRQIAKTADVNLAALNYHFGSKDSVIRSIIEYRSQQLGARRSELLDKIESAEASSLTAIMSALVVPVAEITADKECGGCNFVRFKLDVRTYPWALELLEKAFAPHTDRFLDALVKVTPHLDPADRVIRFTIAKEAVDHLFANMVLPGWFARHGVESTERLAAVLIDFLTAGFADAPPTLFSGAPS